MLSVIIVICQDIVVMETRHPLQLPQRPAGWTRDLAGATSCYYTWIHVYIHVLYVCMTTCQLTLSTVSVQLITCSYDSLCPQPRLSGCSSTLRAGFHVLYSRMLHCLCCFMLIPLLIVKVLFYILMTFCSFSCSLLVV